MSKYQTAPWMLEPDVGRPEQEETLIESRERQICALFDEDPEAAPYWWQELFLGWIPKERPTFAQVSQRICEHFQLECDYVWVDQEGGIFFLFSYDPDSGGHFGKAALDPPPPPAHIPPIPAHLRNM